MTVDAEHFDVGMVGLGKLGLPVSVAIAEQGHRVRGYDVDEEKIKAYRAGRATEGTGSYEPDLDAQLQRVLGDTFHLVEDVTLVVRQSEIVFVAVPTPSRDDGRFDLSSVRQAVSILDRVRQTADGQTVIAVVSTVLPGDMRQVVAGEVQSRAGLYYNPSFVAMGTAVEDFLDPEFVLIGEPETGGGEILKRFYEVTIGPGVRIRLTTWENAELIKMCYNTMIGMKIGFANVIMELCHYTPTADTDVVTDALQQATDRIASGAYLRGGMGDGGGCHPRDNRALGALAEEYDTAVNPFQYTLTMRREQSRWLASLVVGASRGDAITVVGARYKAGSNLTLDSPSLLLAAHIEEVSGRKPHVYDPQAGYDTRPPDQPHTFAVTVDAPFVHEFDYPAGSTVVDVWRCLELSDDVKHVPVGAGPEPSSF